MGGYGGGVVWVVIRCSLSRLMRCARMFDPHVDWSLKEVFARRVRRGGVVGPGRCGAAGVVCGDGVVGGVVAVVRGRHRIW